MTNLKFKSGDKVKIKVKLGEYKNKDYPEKGEICTLLKLSEVNADGSNVWVFEEYPKGKMAERNIQLQFNSWFEPVYENKDEKETEMLKYEDIVEGAEIECIETVELNNAKFIKGHVYKIEVGHYNINTLLIKTDYPKNGHDNYAFMKSNFDCRDRYKYFKLVKKEAEMNNTPVLLDPEIYAVGTIHNSIDNRYRFKIIKRDIFIDNYDEPFMIVKNQVTKNIILYHQNTGKCHNSMSDSTNLVITKKKIKGWINVYGYNSSFSGFHETKEKADFYAMKDRVACIEIEFEEGEGL